MWSVKFLPKPGLARTASRCSSQRVRRRHGDELGGRTAGARSVSDPCSTAIGTRIRGTRVPAVAGCGAVCPCTHPLRAAGGPAGSRPARLARGGRRWRRRLRRSLRTAAPRSARSAATARSTRGGLVGRPRCSSSMRDREDRRRRVGLALPGDVGRGAVDRLEHARRGAASGLMLPLAARPMPPVMAAARSVMMSPKRLSVTITSNRAGRWPGRSSRRRRAGSRCSTSGNSAPTSSTVRRQRWPA